MYGTRHRGSEEVIYHVYKPNVVGSSNFLVQTTYIKLYIPYGTHIRLDHWIPTENPKPGENFFGVDRSQYPVGLTSFSENMAKHGNDMIKAINHSCYAIDSQGGRPSLLLAPTGWVNATYGNLYGSPGLNTIVINTTYGSMQVVESPDLQDKVYVLDKDTWYVDQHDTIICTNPGRNAVIHGIGSYAKSLNYSKLPIICECGAEAVKSSIHSHWCPKC
jgi:hypothetical protein